jgi:hypothetical protein
MSVKRKRNLYDPASSEPFPLSRSKIECFTKCPRCFYLDRRLGVSPPGIPALVLNSTVGKLLEHEFDACRERCVPHPLMVANNLDGVVPYKSESLAEWRSPFKGVRYLHQPTNLVIFGAPDDIWVDGKTLIVCDFKATASKERTIKMDSPYRLGYIRQVETYQWLLRQNGFAVSSRGFLLFANAKVDRPSFDARLDFDLSLIEVVGRTDWIEPTLTSIKSTLMADVPPPAAPDCENCRFVAAVNDAVGEA